MSTDCIYMLYIHLNMHVIILFKQYILTHLKSISNNVLYNQKQFKQNWYKITSILKFWNNFNFLKNNIIPLNPLNISNKIQKENWNSPTSGFFSTFYWNCTFNV